jgi:hypothetical protein
VYKRKAIAGLCGYAGRMWQPSKPRPPQPLRGVSVRTTRCASDPRDTTSRSGVCESARSSLHILTISDRWTRAPISCRPPGAVTPAKSRM